VRFGLRTCSILVLALFNTLYQNFVLVSVTLPLHTLHQTTSRSHQRQATSCSRQRQATIRSRQRQTASVRLDAIFTARRSSLESRIATTDVEPIIDTLRDAASESLYRSKLCIAV
jgi:hypothetical protein